MYAPIAALRVARYSVLAARYSGFASTRLQTYRCLSSTGVTASRSVTASKPSSAARRVGRVLGGVGVIAAGGGAVRYATDEGTRRSVTFWSRAAPIYAHYRYVQWMVDGLGDEEQDAAYNELHDRYAPDVEELVFEMRGFYLKTAQMASTLDSFLPDQYMEWCKKCQDEVPTEMAPGQARAIIEANLGKKIEEVFDDFEEVPCGSASIGQVHRAKLKKSGQEVAIKVQAPGIERKFRADIKTVKDFVWLALPQHVSPMEEIEKQFATEFDYVGEAHNLNDIYNNIMPVFGDKVVIPRPLLSLCTKDILVMEFLHGKSLLKGVKEFFQEYAKSQGRTYEEIEEEQLALIRSGAFKFKEVNEEAEKMKRIKYFVDLQCNAKNVAIGCFNNSLGLIVGQMPYAKPPTLLNLAEIVRTISIVHGHEIMVDGAFNGDPHPGNILLLNDGRLGLIDYGQVKRIPKEMRLHYARLILALADNDQVAAVKEMREMGYRTKYMKDEVTYLLGKFWNDNNSREVVGDMNPQTFIDWCEAEDPVIEVPQDAIMPGRVAFLLRAVGNAFGIDLSMAKLWKPIAEQVLREHKEEDLQDEIQDSLAQKPEMVRRYSALLHRKKSYRDNLSAA